MRRGAQRSSVGGEFYGEVERASQLAARVWSLVHSLARARTMVLGSAYSVPWSYGAGDELWALQLASFSALSRALGSCEFWDSNCT